MAQNDAKSFPNHEELEDLMLSCRYGDLEDVQAFVDRFGWDPVAEVRDESGNTVVHMICGNGHLETGTVALLDPTSMARHSVGVYSLRPSLTLWITGEGLTALPLLHLLNYILPHIPGSLLEVENTSGRSTPLHWAAINAHLLIAQAIISHPGGPGPLLINAHNAAGMSPLGEAELAGADDVAKWFVEVMTIEQGHEIIEGKEAEEQTQDDEEAVTRGPAGSKPTAEGSTKPQSQLSESLESKAEKLTL